MRLGRPGNQTLIYDHVATNSQYDALSTICDLAYTQIPPSAHLMSIVETLSSVSWCLLFLYPFETLNGKDGYASCIRAIECGCDLFQRCLSVTANDSSHCLLVKISKDPRSVTALFLVSSNTYHRYTRYTHCPMHWRMSNTPTASQMECPICLAPIIIPHSQFDNSCYVS